MELGRLPNETARHFHPESMVHGDARDAGDIDRDASDDRQKRAFCNHRPAACTFHQIAEPRRRHDSQDQRRRIEPARRNMQRPKYGPLVQNVPRRVLVKITESEQEEQHARPFEG